MRPTQIGIPGGPEILIFLLIGPVIAAALAYYIYTDAEKRGPLSSPRFSASV